MNLTDWLVQLLDFLKRAFRATTLKITFEKNKKESDAKAHEANQITAQAKANLDKALRDLPPVDSELPKS